MSSVKGKQLNSIVIVLDKYKYYVAKNKLTAYCARRNKKCRAKIDFKDEKWTKNEENHNHDPPEIDYVLQKKVEEDILLRCETSNESFKTIFDSACKK